MCTSDLVISSENTVGNLQSKTIRRQKFTKTSSADSAGTHVEEVQDTENVTLSDMGEDLSNEEHTQGKDYCEETPESDIPGAQLAAASRRIVKPSKAKEGGSANNFRTQSIAQGDLNSKKDDGINFSDPPSLNTMLATASCEKESQQQPIQPRIVKGPMTKIPRTEFPNGPPTLTQLFESESSQGIARSQISEIFKETQIEGSISCRQKDQVTNNASESQTCRISEKTTSSSRFAISLPPQHNRLSSMAMFREEIKRKYLSDSSETDVKEPKASKLTGLQKIRAKMMSSHHSSLGSEAVQKKQEQILTPETSTLASGTRQTRSHSSDDVHEHVEKKSDTSFNITKLRRLAEKMRGPSRRHSDPEGTKIAGITTEGINQSKAITLESCTKIETSGDEKIHNSVIISRKRSVDIVSLNCDNVVPCKSTKINSCENLVRSCDQQTVSTGSSGAQFQSNDSKLPSPVSAVPKRTFLTTESFLQSIHDVRMIEMLPDEKGNGSVHQSSNTDGTKVSVDKLPTEDNENADTKDILSDKKPEEGSSNYTTEKNSEMKNFNFTGHSESSNQRPVQNLLHFATSADTNRLLEQRPQDVPKSFPHEPNFLEKTTEAPKGPQTEPAEMLSETKEQVDMPFDRIKQGTVSANWKQFENSTSDDLTMVKDDANICSTQVVRDLATTFQPTISGDFCMEFSPVKFDRGIDSKQDNTEKNEWNQRNFYRCKYQKYKSQPW